MLAAAKAFSASSVAITDVRPGNLPVATMLGAQHALDQSQAQSSAETVEAIMAVFPEGPDIVIDCVGMSNTITVSSQQKTKCYGSWLEQDIRGGRYGGWGRGWWGAWGELAGLQALKLSLIHAAWCLALATVVTPLSTP